MQMAYARHGEALIQAFVEANKTTQEIGDIV